MTFLNPFVLFALTAAAIPILIHLFNIRKLRTVEFSTLAFLKELQKNKMRKIKVRQWLLLALRTLIILLIVLAFSRPALKGNFGSAGSRAKSTLVILFDNSASMELNNERGKFLSQAQTQALKIVSLLQENDDVFFIRLSDLPNATTEEPTHDIRKLESLIRETEISYNYRTIENGLRLASRLLQQSKNFNKEVYVITDGQATTLSSRIEKKFAEEKLFEPQVKVFYTQLSQRQIENVAIEKTTIPPSLLQINKPFTLSVVVKNYGTTSVGNHLVSVTLDNNRVMQKSVSLGGGESATLDFGVTPSYSGFISGFVEMEDDAYESDNRWFFSVNIPAQINVAIVAPEEKYSRYISAALNVAALTNSSSPISVSNIFPSQITTTTLSHNDVVIFSGVKELSISQQDVLHQYVINGGNLFFFPAVDSTAVSYTYLKLLGLTNFQITKSATTFENVDLRFPIFQGMFEQGLQKNKINVESPQISVSLNITSETNLRSIISLSSGKNFLWLREVGRGKILGASVPATTEWSDFPLKGIFVPLLYQSVLYLSSPLNTADESNYFVGEKVEFTSSQLKKGRSISPTSLQLFDTGHRKIPLQPYSKTTNDGISQSIFTFENPNSAGIYVALDRNDTILALPINVRREESNGTLAEDEQIMNVLKHLGISETSFVPLPPDSEIEKTISQSRFGVELWRYFLIVAVIIAFIEMFIAREPKQK